MQASKRYFLLGNLIHFHLLLGSSEEERLVESVELIPVVESSVAKIVKRIPLESSHILFSFGENVIPETGDSGFWEGKNVARVIIDPKHKNKVEKIVKQHLPKTLAHELCHLSRLQTLGFRSTLLDALIDEGLADRFADSLYPKPVSPWTKALGEKQTETLLQKAKRQLHKDYDHDEWFFGKGKGTRWAGYTLGYRIVGEAIEKGGKSAADFVKIPAKEILTLSAVL